MIGIAAEVQDSLDSIDRIFPTFPRRMTVNNLLAWLLFGVALAWSALIGALAGVGAVAIARRATDTLNVIVAVLFMFGGALVLAAQMVPARFMILGILGFGGGILLAMVLRAESPLPLFRDVLEDVVEEAVDPSEWPEVDFTTGTGIGDPTAHE
jgi:hypothetical protein